MPSKRELIDNGTDKRYVRRDEQGRFKESDDIGKSLSQDRRRRTKTVEPKRNAASTSPKIALTISLFPQHASKLKDLAREAGVSPEEFLRAKITNWLSDPDSDFAEAAAYVVKKNAELYRRLA